MPNPQTAQVYAFIQATLRQQGYPPNFDEIGQACQLRRGQVLTSLMRLEYAGRLCFHAARPRSLRLPEEG